MINKRASIVGLGMIIVLLFSVVVYLMFFASKGARYTWDDGVIDRVINLERYIELKQTIAKERKINLERYNDLQMQINKLKEINNVK